MENIGTTNNPRYLEETYPLLTIILTITEI